MTHRLEDRILDCLRQDLDKNCIFWDGQWITRKTIVKIAEKNRKVLLDAGFKEGHRVAMLLPNCPAFLGIALAAWSLGGTIVPLNMRSGSEVLLPSLDMTDPFVTIFSEGDSKVDDFLKKGYFAYGVGLDGSLSDITGKTDSEKNERDLAVIFTTSGTTGMPKAVPLTHENLLDNVDRSFEVLDFKEDDRLLWVLPNFHSFGLTLGGLLPHINGLRQIIVPLFMPPGATLEAIKAGEATVLFLVPAMVEFLKRSVQHGNPKPEKVRMVVTGGDRLNLELDNSSRDYLGVPILEGYGTTECSPVVAVNRNYDARKLGTIGPVLPGYEWEVRNDQGQHVGPGEDGILWVKGPSVFNGYYKAPEITAGKLVDGWYNTGDVVRYDEDGFITVLDRVTDIIIVGGFNVYPQEVERVLNTHPAVASVIVVAMPHPVQGQIGRAFVITEENVSVSQRELISFCKGKLAHYKIPRRIDFVDSLPMSPSGKVLRRELRDIPL